MKRSEMLKEIELVLWDSENLNISYVGSDGFGALANDILEIIEEKGMIPPYRGSINCFTYSGDIGEQEIYEWEPEDV